MLLLILALACTDKGGDDTGTPAETGETGETGEPGEGTLAITFAMDADYIAIMDEEPVGRFWGVVWRSEDVTSIGPGEDAVGLADVYVEEVDLRPDGATTAVLAITGPIPAIEVCILGFMDSDANATEDPDPDEGDPVTLPGDNRFDVVADAETTVEVYFGLLNP